MKKRAEYVKKNTKTINEDNRASLPDGTTIQYGIGVYRYMEKQSYPVKTPKQAFYSPVLPRFNPILMIPAISPIIVPVPLPTFSFWSIPILIG